MSHPGTESHQTPRYRPRIRASHFIFLFALACCAGAAFLTATGLTSVAIGSGVPKSRAWVYVVCTDGLGGVGYAAVPQFDKRIDRVYAWAVVVLSTVLSGAAQGVHQASAGVGGTTAQVAVKQEWLRFVIGFWPAIATAIILHLIWLIRHQRIRAAAAQTEKPASQVVVEPEIIDGVAEPMDEEPPATASEPDEDEVEELVIEGREQLPSADRRELELVQPPQPPKTRRPAKAPVPAKVAGTKKIPCGCRACQGAPVGRATYYRHGGIPWVPAKEA